MAIASDAMNCKKGRKGEQELIWDYFQNDEEMGDVAFNAESRYRFLGRQISTGRRVLNVGVGRGGLEKILLESTTFVSSLDPNQASIDRIQRDLGLGKEARVGFSQDMPFKDDCFDYVVMTEVMEHLRSDLLEATLKEVFRVLRSGGKFIGTVPADEDLLVSRVVCPDCGKIFHRWGHMQSFNKQLLLDLLGTVLSEPKVSRKYFVTFRGLNWKGRLGCSAKKILVAWGFKGYGESFFFEAKKLG